MPVLAVLVKEDLAEQTLEELSLADAVRYQKMSDLVAADNERQLLLVLVDERLGVLDAVSKKLSNCVVESFMPPGDCYKIIEKMELLKAKPEATPEVDFEDDLPNWTPASVTPLARAGETPRPIAKRTEEAVKSAREPIFYPVDEEEEDSKETAWDDPKPQSSPANTANASPFTADVEPSEIFFRRRTTPLLMLEGPKGGVGRSTIGAHMALYAALKGKRVAVVDLDVNGDISEKFGILQSGDTRGWRGSSMEEAVRDGICHVHESGVHLIPSPQSRDVVLIQPDDALYLVEMAMNDMDVVFVDMPQGWTPLHRILLPYCSEIMMAVKSAPDSLGRVEEHAEKFVHAHVPIEKVSVVVNQAKQKSELKQMKRYLEPYVPKVVVPFDKQLAAKGGLNGKKLTLACRSWWDASLGFKGPTAKKQADTANQRRGFFRR